MKSMRRIATWLRKPIGYGLAMGTFFASLMICFRFLDEAYPVDGIHHGVRIWPYILGGLG